MTATAVTDLAPQIYEKAVAETRTIEVNMSGKLRADELLTGTPTVTVSPSGLTLGSPTISTDAMMAVDAKGRVALVDAGKVIIVSASAGAADAEYTITVICSTDATPAQVVRGRARLNVV